MVICPSCKAEAAAGMRWCGICHFNIVNPAIGRLASPGRKLGAYFLDLLIPSVALFFVIVVFGLGLSSGTEGRSAVGGLLSFGLFVAYVIWALVLFARGTTPGKKLLGLRVVKEDGSSAGFLTMLIREWVGKAISGMIFALGFLWILLDRDKQGWHDKLMSTYVVG